MVELFNTVLVYPLLNVLVLMYNYIPDIGVCIILLTVLIRLLMYPSFHKSLKHQREIQALQPKMNEIKEKYKDDQQRQAAAMMELYKTHKVNPLSSCLPILIQIPVLIALYQVFIQSLNGADLIGLYGFIENPGHVNAMFLGAVDLALKNNYLLAAIAALTQFYMTRMMQNRTPQGNTDPTTKLMGNYLLYFLPALTFFFGIQFPAGLSLYWITSNFFGIAQQYLIIKREATQALYGKQ